MLRRALNLLFFILATGLLWYLNRIYFSESLMKWYYTAIALTVTYFIFRFVFQELVSKGIPGEKFKYSFRKTVGVLFWLVFLIITVRIWILNPQALLVAYGLIGAGVAVALQDFFKNFVGGITVFTTGPYRVGDRIEINGEFGDVIDIGLMYTTVMEMREWVGGDQASGRICTIPNGFILSHVLNNYTRDHHFIWDEIMVPITYDSDWKEAHNKIMAIAKKETRAVAEQAEHEIKRIKERYFVAKREVQPQIFVTMTDNWIQFNIRYVTDAKNRRILHNKLTQLILEEIQKSKRINIASTSLKIIGYPEAKAKRF